MIADFRAMEDGVPLKADICIVGAGAAGIALAREFSGGIWNVIVLESGGLEEEPATQDLNSGESVGLRHDGLHRGRLRAFGGTTRLWSGQCIPLEELDFEPRAWVPYSGWPIRRKDLDPYYRRALPLFSLESNAQFDESLWRGFGLTPPQLDSDRVVSRFTIYSAKPDLGRISRKLLEKARNVRVLLHANVVYVRANESNNAIEAVEVRSLRGKSASVRARAVILCCGGIENARLLLCSNLRDGAGVGNRNDLVGRFFQDHPKCFGATVVPKSARFIQTLYSLFYRGGSKYFPKLALSEERQRSARSLSCIADLAYEFEDDSAVGIAKRVYGAWRDGKPKWVSPTDLARLLRVPDQTASILFQRLMRGRSAIGEPISVRLQLHVEQAPNPMSRITLSEQKDQLGFPKAKVDWWLTEQELGSIRLLVRDVATEFDRLGMAKIEPDGWLDEPRSEPWTDRVEESYHHMGTTRMSDSAAEGVVDANCEVHGCRGLYVAGSSVFPTSGYANPTLTIVALAIRLADHMKLVRRDEE